VNGYITAPHATISAHRLWTKLWTRLGKAEDNPIRPGGNRAVNGGGRAGIHSGRPPGEPPGTVAVDARTRPDLRRRLMSPVSTDPMTTTFRYFTEIPSTKQASRRLRPASRWNVPRTGGSFL